MAIVAVAAFAGAAGTAAWGAAVVAAVSVAVTVVGAVTKNPTLMKIGAGLGAGGSVASAAGWSGAWAGGTTATEAGTVASTASEAGTAAGGTEVASNATGMATNSTGTSLRAAEGAAGIGYGGEGVAGAAVPVAADGSRIRTIGDGMGGMDSTATFDKGGILESATAQPAQVASVASVAQPGNATGTTVRAMEGGSNAVYNGTQASGGTSYWDSLGSMWKNMDSGDKQIVGGIIKGVGQGAASYMSESMKTQAQIDAENRLRNNRSNFTPVRWSTK